MLPNQGWQVEFYTDHRDRSPIMDYLDDLPQKEQAKIRNHIRLLRQFGNQLGPPHAKQMKGNARGVWELRPMPTRIFYFFHTGRWIILLHAFLKKKDRTDANEIQIALNRMKTFMEREDE